MSDSDPAIDGLPADELPAVEKPETGPQVDERPTGELPAIELPVVRDSPATPRTSRPLRAITLHVLRGLMFIVTLVCIRYQHDAFSSDTDQPLDVFPVAELQSFFRDASSVANRPAAAGALTVLDADNEPLGYIVQTSPMADDIIGFSGPTNVLLAFDPDDRLVGCEILSSRDTREHVEMIELQPALFVSWRGLTWDELAERSSLFDRSVDAVSGATLTSLAIAESVGFRLTGERPASLKFPEPITLAESQTLFPEAVRIALNDSRSQEWRVYSSDNRLIGTVIRTSPAADEIVGYQGPTDTLIALNQQTEVVGIRLRSTFDNEKYVTYVREEEYFLTLFNGLSLQKLSELDLLKAQVEGVSGATMTSMSVADGLLAAAQARLQTRAAEEETRREQARQLSQPNTDDGSNWFIDRWHTWSTVLVVLWGLYVSAVPGKHRRGFKRRLFQFVAIIVIGVLNGDLISQAIIVAWAQHGAPIAFAPGLVLMTSVALLWPLFSRQQPYCQHLCPHGAVQQIAMNRFVRWKLPRHLRLVLSCIPFILLGLILVAALQRWPVSLVDFEPFDAWVIGVAGVAAASIAVIGLVVSLFVPMAYCRYGCPTGALLQFLKFSGRSDIWSRRDWAALLLMSIAIGFIVS